jgi:NAD(P)H-flavin reductase
MDDDAPFNFKAGQFNMLGIHGICEAPISFSSNLLYANSFAHTVRFVGNVTEIIRRLKPGDAIQVRGPYGSGWPVELIDVRDVIVVAGGIGMAPLRPIVHELVERKRTGGGFYILYGARTPDDLMYKDEIRKWKGNYGARVLITVDEEVGDMGLVDEVGVVTTLFKKVDIDFKEAICLMCGPEIMMRFAARDLILKGAAPSSIHVSLERRMYCGIGHCGHCQIGAKFVCKDGPVFKYNDITRFSDTLL